MRKAIFLTLAATALGSALAGSAGAPVAAPIVLGHQSYSFTCGKQAVKVTYVTTGTEKSGNPVFMVLEYSGKTYGLAPAVSGSGSRYVGLAGLNNASGLEWWEHQGEATLSTFKGDNASNAKVILTCKTQ